MAAEETGEAVSCPWMASVYCSSCPFTKVQHPGNEVREEECMMTAKIALAFICLLSKA